MQERNYDVVLIDCPPNFNIVTKNALVASDAILVPALPDYLSTLGISYLTRSVNQLVSEFNEFLPEDPSGEADAIHPSILGVVFTMVRVYGGEPIAAHRGYIARVRSQQQRVFDSYIRRHPSAFINPPENGVPAVLSSSHGGVVDELEAITSEFCRVLGE